MAAPDWTYFLLHCDVMIEVGKGKEGAGGERGGGGGLVFFDSIPKILIIGDNQQLNV